MDYVSFDGKITKACQIPLAQGYLYGYGLFETINVIDGTPVFFSEHMRRLREGAAFLELHLETDERKIWLDSKNVIEANGVCCAALRLTLAKGMGVDHLLLTMRENHYQDARFDGGIKVCISEQQRNEKSLLVRIKSNNYLENLLILNEAKRQGYQEAIFLNTKGFLAEGCTTNLFFVKDQVVYTPAVDCGLLPGILRGKVIDTLKSARIKCEVGCYTREQLLEADEVFVTNSLMGIMPVHEVGERGYPVGEKTLTHQIKAQLPTKKKQSKTLC